MKIYEGQNVPVKSYCENPEMGAILQAMNLAMLPFIFRQVLLMPDAHQGYGMPIGGVIATKGVVIPNAVGVDIGCGMIALKTSLRYEDVTTEMLKQILGGSKEFQGGIRANIPYGNGPGGCHQVRQAEIYMPFRPPNYSSDIPVVSHEYNSALKQLGTLGGGNHFIEIQHGNDGYIWVMIHSGSRNLGYKVAKHYNKVAQDLCKKWYSNIPEYKGEDGLAFLPLDSEEGIMYLTEMNYALKYAYANRLHMIENVKKAFLNVVDCKFSGVINIHHNYAQMEHHFGYNVMIHRKGATSAKEGEMGIIPGSQGTASYIVKGKGNIESFKSCSHGAGRKMSRKKARATLNFEEEQKKLDDKGILHSLRYPKNLDEADSAYKDINVVMEEQKDLVEIVVELKALAGVKG